MNVYRCGGCAVCLIHRLLHLPTAPLLYRSECWTSGPSDPSTLPSTLPLSVRLDGFLRRAQVHYANGKHIRYIAAGPRDGPLLIFVHGWPAIATSWKPQLAYFSSIGYRTIAPDMPGSGRSTALKTNVAHYSVESVVAGLLTLLAHIGRTQAL
jgi:hypothetical protein